MTVVFARWSLSAGPDLAEQQHGRHSEHVSRTTRSFTLYVVCPQKPKRRRRSLLLFATGQLERVVRRRDTRSSRTGSLVDHVTTTTTESRAQSRGCSLFFFCCFLKFSKTTNPSRVKMITDIFQSSRHRPKKRSRPTARCRRVRYCWCGRTALDVHVGAAMDEAARTPTPALA